MRYIYITTIISTLAFSAIIDSARRTDGSLLNDIYKNLTACHSVDKDMDLGIVNRLLAVEHELNNGERNRYLHQEANKAFMQAYDCGSKTAPAHLGVAHCHGLGDYSKDTQTGLQLIHDSTLKNKELLISSCADLSVLANGQYPVPGWRIK
jgi:hypothetical protein